MQQWLGTSFDYFRQSQGDIGQKMNYAFTRVFQDGAPSAILIGSDIPDLSATIIKQGYSSLKSSEIVIGPSRDGGYYLIGCTAKNKHHLLPLLFENMAWSSPNVFSTTINRLEKADISYTLLPVLQDIDHPRDIILAKRRGLL
jgi:rSAM/selenodomain-associated transferase 1